MPPDDVILAKVEIIERCLKRVRDVYAGDPVNLHQDLTRQDSILLNLERACQASIDLALRLVALRGLGLPRESREAFVLIEQAGVIDHELAVALQRMVGFRNLAVHNYRQIDLLVVQRLIENRLEDLARFCRVALAL
jgi:uncharacterized protein YutE (UPF0331/DUF86 family)